MPAHLENSAVATGLEKVSFHSNPKERQCQTMLKLPHNCTHDIVIGHDKNWLGSTRSKVVEDLISSEP